MNPVNKKLIITLYTVTFFLLLGSDVFALEEISSGRKLWDNVMLWVNFGILVFLFLKFGKKPFMNFLRGEGDKIKETLDVLDAQHEEARSKMDVESDKMGDIEKRIDEIREHLVQIGQKEKNKIIEQAETRARQLIEKAESEANYRFISAKKALNDELADIAIAIVADKLTTGITSDDNDILINKFIGDLAEGKTLPLTES